MSELHATGSPIAAVAPFINHYPLAILFCGFGYFVATFFDRRAAKISGVLIICHGLATLAVGYFPCDVGCSPETASASQVLHGLAGLVILITFLVAPAIWGAISKREIQLRWFGWFSVGVVLAQLLIMIPTVNAISSGELFGLYQRLAYSIPLVWLFVFAAVLVRQHGETRL